MTPAHQTESLIAQLEALIDKVTPGDWRPSRLGFQVVSDAKGPCDVSVAEISTKGYSAEEQVALANYLAILSPANLRTLLDSLRTAERELAAISEAIGTTRFMDPPDGGDVSLAEQVRRMKTALASAEAAESARSREVERLREALVEIADPIGTMKARLPEGGRLDGSMAVYLSNDPGHLKTIARQALEAPHE